MPTNLIIRFPDRLRLRVDSAERGASDLVAAITGTVLEGTPVPGMVCSLGPGAMAAAADLVDISALLAPRRRSGHAGAGVRLPGGAERSARRGHKQQSIGGPSSGTYPAGRGLLNGSGRQDRQRLSG